MTTITTTSRLKGLITKSQLHSKVVGDIDASITKIQKKNLTKIIGTMPLQRIVPTDQCEPYSHNRDTKIETISSQLAAEGGFNWQLFGSIEGIENKQTGQIEIWDGLGRLLLAQLSHVQMIPVIVHEEGSPGALFIKKQKLRNRALNPEAHFVSYASEVVQGKPVVNAQEDAKILKELSILKAAGMRVESGINNYFPQVKDTTQYPTVSISALRRSLKINDGQLTEIKLARDMIYSAYPTSGHIGKELLEGCVFLFTACPAAGKNGTYKSLCTFLKNMSNMPQKDLPFKQLGGNQHNDEARCVALGIWEMWSKDDCSTGNPRTVLRRKHIEDHKR